MSERMMLMLTITRRGDGAHVIDMLEKNYVPWHFRLVGQGTAPSEMMDLLGLGSRDKDIIGSLCTKSAAELFAHKLEEDPMGRRGHGILMIIPLTAIGSIAAVLTEHMTGAVPEMEEETKMKNEYKHSLILIAVNRGLADEVMTVAKQAGVTGGTVLRANLADNKAGEMLGVTLAEEREVVAILAPDTIRDKVMENVNREFGLRTDAQAVICAVGVDKAMRI